METTPDRESLWALAFAVVAIALALAAWAMPAEESAPPTPTEQVAP